MPDNAMKKGIVYILPIAFCALISACSDKSPEITDKNLADTTVLSFDQKDVGRADSLPAPTESAVKNSNVVGWPEGKTPKAPKGFVVKKFADDLKNPRWIYVLPNGDVLVSEAMAKTNLAKKVKAFTSGKWKSTGTLENANRITLFRDKNNDGIPEIRETFLEDLYHPFGMLLIDSTFFVANTNGVVTFPYHKGDLKIKAKGKKIVELPANGYNNHWTRNIVTNPDKTKLFISVGSGSNVAENGLESEKERANILTTNLDGSDKKIYASGLRNPVGMDWEPRKKELWTAVNERDELGDELVPDYLTSVQENGFYGWPWWYFGKHEDPRLKERPALDKDVLVPDLPLGAHTASLGLIFYTGKQFPAHYKEGAFIGQHGSWNSSKLVGYKVVFVPFENGKPKGAPEDFLTGFISDLEKGEVFGRPVGVAISNDGGLLVADDAANTIWKIETIKK